MRPAIFLALGSPRGYCGKAGGRCEKVCFTTVLVAPPVPSVRPRQFTLPLTSPGDASYRIALP
jgi:hypothetical protein